MVLASDDLLRAKAVQAESGDADGGWIVAIKDSVLMGSEDDRG